MDVDVKEIHHLTHFGRRAPRIPAPDRRQDALMFGNAPQPPLVFIHRVMGSHDDESKEGNQQPLQHLLEHWIPGLPAQSEMEAQIALIERLQVAALHRRTHIRNHLIEFREIRLVPGEQCRGQGFQSIPNLKVVGDVLRPDQRHPGNASITAGNEAFGLQNIEGRTDGGLGNVELGSPFALDDGFARGQGAGNDLIAKAGSDGVFDQRRGGRGKQAGDIHEKSAPRLDRDRRKYIG